MLTTFRRFHSNSQEVSYLPWQNKYSNQKTVFHIKPIFFLWIKLLENLLLGKYFVFVSSTFFYKRFRSLAPSCLTSRKLRRTSKQPPTSVLQKSFSEKFWNIHRKTPKSKSVTKKVEGLENMFSFTFLFSLNSLN